MPQNVHQRSCCVCVVAPSCWNTVSKSTDLKTSSRSSRFFKSITSVFSEPQKPIILVIHIFAQVKMCLFAHDDHSHRGQGLGGLDNNSSNLSPIFPANTVCWWSMAWGVIWLMFEDLLRHLQWYSWPNGWSGVDHVWYYLVSSHFRRRERLNVVIFTE